MATDGSADASRFAVIVRTHNPSRSMMHRVVAWANSAAVRQCEFAVSIDVTHPPGRFAAEVLRRFLPPTAHVHEYDDAAMRAAWPVLERECRPRLDRATFGGMWREYGPQPLDDQRVNKRDLPNTFAWCFHVESINLCVEQTAMVGGATVPL